MSDAYTPRREDKFSFGLWNVGNRGRDPFGDVVRDARLNHRVEVSSGVLAEECGAVLRKFFAARRGVER